MNKYLLMSAAAALAATAGSGVASAATTVHFTRSGTSYCDYFVISGASGLYAAVHHAPNCGSSAINDAGVLDKKGKVPGHKGSVQFADVTWAMLGIGDDGLDFDLGMPFGSASWAIVVSENGTSAIVLNGGGQKPAKAKPGATKSTLTDAIKSMGK